MIRKFVRILKNIEKEFGARVGDSIVVTEDGFEYLTPWAKRRQIL
jgi:Xaa-Pro aminopeptidase